MAQVKKLADKFAVYDGDRIVSLCSDEGRAQEICSALSEHAASDLPTETLSDVKIFRAGSWTSSDGRTTKWTVADLKQMVQNFATLRDRVRPFFKMRHLDASAQNKITAGASLGWVDNLRVRGDTLIGDITNVPAKLAQLIRAGRFIRVSAEIFRRFRDEATGKVFKNVLSAVGLLGAQHPAVTTLGDLVALHDGGGDLSGLLPANDAEWVAMFQGLDGADSVAMTYSAETPEGGDLMDEKAVQAMIDVAVSKARDEAKAEYEKTLEEHDKALKDAAATFQNGVNEALGTDADADPIAEIKALKDSVDDAAKEIAQRDRKDFEAKVAATIEKAKTDGKMLPSQEAGIKTMVEAWTISAAQADDGKLAFMAGKDEKRGSVLDALVAYFDAQPKVLNFGEVGESGVSAQPGSEQLPADVRAELMSNSNIGVDQESAKLDAKVKAYAI